MKISTGSVALAALCAIPSPAAAKPKAPKPDTRAAMSAQDLVTLPRLGGAAVSGDGSLAVYPITETDPASYKRTTALYLRSLTDKRGAPVKLDSAAPPAARHSPMTAGSISYPIAARAAPTRSGGRG